MHGLLEVDGIEDFDPVRLIDDLAVLILHGFAVLASLEVPRWSILPHSTRMVPLGSVTT